MAGELRHANVGIALDAAEWVDISTHILNDGVAGDLLYYNGTRLVRLPIGPDGTLVKAVGGIPTYSAAAAVAHYTVKRITVTDSPYSVNAANDDIVEVDSSSGPVTVVMPTAAGNAGRAIDVKKVSVDTNLITINPQGGQTIEGGANLTMDVPGVDVTLYGSTATNWNIK